MIIIITIVNLSLINNKTVIKTLELILNLKHRTNKKYRHRKRKNCFLKAQIENADWYNPH